MAHPNEEVVRTASEALVKQDYDTFLTFHHPDVVVHAPMNQTLRGHDEIRQNFQQMDSMLDSPSELTIHDILANDEHAIVLAKVRATKDGKSFDMDQFVVIHLLDGKAKEVWVHLTDPQAAMEFMGMPA
jgi:ketosteroid isomerase-like protein